eukprot:29357_1
MTDLDSSKIFKFLNSNEKDLLVFGFIRINYLYYIPTDIQNLFYSYYRHELKWTISNKDLIELERNHHEKLTGPSFETDKAKFICSLSYQRDTSQIHLNIKLESTCSDTKDLTLFRCIYCNETKLSSKTSTVLALDDISEMSSIVFNIFDDKQYKNLKTLTFNIFVEILNINIYQPSIYKNYRKIIMNSNINYEWSINKYLLNQFKYNCYCYSPNFGLYG